jgi:membrane protease YdiL (CAAX protease family)
MGPEPDQPSALPERAAIAREAWLAGAGILAALLVLKHLGRALPAVGEHVFTVAVAVQLYVPLYLVGKRGLTRDSLGLSLSRWREDLRWVALLAVATVVPFALGHHLWQTVVVGRPFSPSLPDHFLADTLLEVGVVALAEEVYFRGYLQERLERIWPARRRLLGAPFGRAVVVTSAIFALAHFVGEYRFARLGPFFPGLVFGLLRARTGTIVGAAGYHAFCNLLGDFLWASYRGG